MKNNPYDQLFLEVTLEELTDVLEDLTTWSVNNGDRGLDEIIELKVLAKKLKRELI